MEEPMNGDAVVDQHVKGILDELVMESAMNAANSSSSLDEQPKTLPSCLPNGSLASPPVNVLLSPLPSTSSSVMSSGTPVILPLIHRPNILNSNAIQAPSTPPSSQETPNKTTLQPSTPVLSSLQSSVTLTPPSTQRDSPTLQSQQQISPLRLANQVQSPTSIKSTTVMTPSTTTMSTPMLVRTSSTGPATPTMIQAVVSRSVTTTTTPNNMIMTNNLSKGPQQQTVLLTQPDGTKVPVVIQTSSTGQTTIVSSSNSITNNSNFLISKPPTVGQQPTLVNQPQVVQTGQVVQQQLQTQQGRQQVIVSNPSVMQQMVLTRPGGPPISLQQFQQQTNAGQQQQMTRGLVPQTQRPNGPFILNGPQGGQLRFASPMRQPTLMATGPQGQQFQHIRGPILIRTENGLQLVNVTGPVSTTPGTPGQAAQGGQLRFQTVQGIRPPSGMVNLASPLRPGMVTVGQQPRPQQQSVQMQGMQQHLNQPQMQSMPTTQPISISTSQANNQAASAAPSQMSPNTAKKKCKNFLSTLIKLANDQPEQVATNVRKLIQGLIDGLIPPENFTDQLQKELKSSPQPCLVPFLKKSLPHLRQSLALGELSIEGVQPPQAVAMTPGGPAMIPQQFQLGRPAIRFMTQMGMPPGVTLIQRPGMSTSHPGMMAGSVMNIRSPAVPPKQESPTKDEVKKTVKKTKATPKGKKEAKETKSDKPEKNKVSNSLREDDDINDVAAMGGVNLQEESQRMAAAANEVGTQIRSCKDDTFLFTNALSNRINRIASTKYNLDDTSLDVVSLVSHAAQERLKTLIERLGVIAEHRLENMKMNPKYEVTQDVRAQIKFLEELDKLEKKRHEEVEREMLIRAAKSRSKLEDPEQVKLKQKAKEMQRAEQEEIRQKEANETALLAIGPRKRMKAEGILSPSNVSGASPSSFNTPSSNNTNNTHFSNSIFSTPYASGSKLPMRRMKRVNMKDLLFLMEQDRGTSKSTLLYRSYAK